MPPPVKPTSAGTPLPPPPKWPQKRLPSFTRRIGGCHGVCSFITVREQTGTVDITKIITSDIRGGDNKEVCARAGAGRTAVTSTDTTTDDS